MHVFFASVALLVQRVLDSSEHTMLGLVKAGDITRLHVVEGWIKYEYAWADRAGVSLESRFVAPHFDANVARACGAPVIVRNAHAWTPEWLLGGESLHCQLCGGDGT